MQITVANIRALLASPVGDPVLYIGRDDETGRPTGIEVWASAYVPHSDVIARRVDIADLVDAETPADDEVLADLLSELQGTVDELLINQH
jgi:hypothetical protein